MAKEKKRKKREREGTLVSGNPVTTTLYRHHAQGEMYLINQHVGRCSVSLIIKKKKKESK